ncbi:TonB-dependent siderophore receptor [Shewanella yunxiaonensis]|uniref:TonB-dependent siderophore receptor n=1 Tax=Shewanella yunxiaonensis TaxID=2829809 RepID=A0ABX7YR63_9GAMM|nr:TonB-dependent siderophore receptor [Shewanella yunxiaonensis]QUN05232.1 TonB-dependent siderophore receptor [Shewanella yunxiaonensis]
MFKLNAITASILLSTTALSFVTNAAEEADADIEHISITGTRENRASSGATGLVLDIQDTPQSISVINNQTMSLFGADNINDALDLVTGVSVERWETNRTNYLSRGFEIKSTQIDGVGLPNSWGIVQGQVDTYGYERIEVIRGANGLLTGVGNSSGTINYIRKRPTNETQGEVGVSVGSYANYRLQADYSTPLTDDKSWAARAVVATEQGNSYLKGYSSDRSYLYGTIDGQLSDNSSIAIGISHQKDNTDGAMWGGLTLVNDDGSMAEFDVSASTAQDWTFWNTENTNAFIEYNYVLSPDWQLALSYNYRESDADARLLFAYTYTGLTESGEGLVGWPGQYPSEGQADIFEAKVSGYFSLFGYDHQLLAGVSRAKSTDDEYYYEVDYLEPAFGDLPAFPYAMNAIQEPTWGDKLLDSITEDTLTRYFVATQLNFDAVAVTLGMNFIEFERSSSSLLTKLDESEVSPYAGISYHITPSIMLYTSYSDIYEPQDYYDVNGDFLAPTKGENYEAGLKTDWFDNKLAANFALFKAKQLGLGVYAGLNMETAQYYYVGEDVYSEGAELDVTGKIDENTVINFGVTHTEIEDENGAKSHAWVPNTVVNFSLEHTLTAMPEVTLGMSGKWQSEISRIESYTGYKVTQGSYAKLNVFAAWDVFENTSIKLNIDNITNEKYITSLWEIGYYGAPREYKLSLDYHF